MSHSHTHSSPYGPLQGICEFLNAFHIYAADAAEGKTRYLEANHYCTHISKDLRQCLVYDSHKPGARLIGVEYMVPKAIYETFPVEEQKLWHSHEFEVRSGMLVLPKPSNKTTEEWEAAELEGMKEVLGLYGKTWHFWQVDRGDAFPFGLPQLMGSLTHTSQLDLATALVERDASLGVDHKKKCEARKVLGPVELAPNADSWWKGQAPPS